MRSRRLKKLPAVVFQQRPDGLLDTVRLFDPDAARTEGGITFGAGIRLSGPYTITQEISPKVDLPPGHAYAASDDGPFQMWLMRGLARRYGGYPRLPQKSIEDDPDEIVVVHTPKRVTPEQLQALVPALTQQRPEDDGSFFMTSQHVMIRCDSPEVESMRWLLPLALGPMRSEPGLHGYRFGGDPRTAMSAALELARRTGGVATDRDRFRIS